MGRWFGGRREAAPSAQQVGGAAATNVESDLVIRFSHAVSSSLSPRTGAVQLSVAGIAGLDETGQTISADDARAEATNNAEQYSAPGVIGRPLPPAQDANGNQQLDMLCVVTADGLVPFAYRDLRIKMGGNAPGEGVFAFVGYGGGFVSHTPVDGGKGGTITMIYVPYAFDSDGNPQKAHTLILDPTKGNESVMLVHGEGMAVTMSGEGKKALLLKNAAGDATFRLDDDGITMTAKQIVMSGGVIIGEPASAVPLLAGIASPPSTKLWVSP